METLIKFSGLDESREFTYSDIWQREVFPDFSRLLIGSRDKEVPMILDLCKDLEGPFYVLFVLLVSPLGNEPARYQSPEPLSFDELELFLYSFQEFIEQDGRHAIWVGSIDGEGQFIFDRHNYVFAYGPLDAYLERLTRAGYSEGTIEIPAPHTHHFHADFGAMEDEILAHWPWVKSPLTPADED